ncbi:nitroreductase family protein [Anaerostipes sp.]|uniref:nitroreductase family protein n=1 Tax=Anaerostipes sp. TaxID=1872530 RepID=UPI0025BFB11B|nr:nitroreductase family protein [Anaerostipes sp.]MBS7009551.1 nitroreductase family protein [Anaerostipes sp.]
MIDAISNRRSIRKFKQKEVPCHLIEEIIRSGIQAPSSKNRQPWRFTVVSGDSKAGMLSAMEQGLQREETAPLLPHSSAHLNGARCTLEIMRKAPVTIFITNALGLDLSLPLTEEDRIAELCNAQSIGAAVQNMTLTAADLGLGSLWICDIFFAYEELTEWLHTKDQLFAALTIGYADEAPDARPRNELHKITKWRN